MSLLEESRITQPTGNQNEPKPAESIEKTLDDLRLASESREVEKICGAYSVLRRRMGAGTQIRELLERVEKVVGPQARLILVAAYSRRHCFMCDAGMVPCDQCDGTGTGTSGKACSACEGFAVTTCTFCRGTGWADPATIPAELRRAVHEKQFFHVQEELKRLKDEMKLTPERFAKLPLEQRRKVGAWLIRLQSRLADLEQRAKDANDTSNQTAFGAAVGEVDQLLHQLGQVNAP